LPIRFVEIWFSKYRAVWISLFLLFFWLSSKGPGFPQPGGIAITLFAALFILYKLHKGGGKSLASLFSLLAFIYVAYFATLLVVAPLPEYGLDKVLETISILLLFFFFMLTIHGKEQIRSWENSLIFVVLLLAFLELLFLLPWYKAWLGISGSVLILPPVSYRLEGIILPGANFTAAFLVLVLPLVVMRFISAITRRSKRLWVACLLLIGVIEFFASSRGGWLAALGAMAITLFFYHQPGLAKWRTKTGGGPACRVGWARGAKFLGFLLLATGIVFLFSLQVQATPGHAGVLSGRETIWARTWEIWSASFWTGRGPGSFPLLYAEEARLPPGWLPTHAHNLWLQTGAETGATGVALVAGMALLLGAGLFKAWSGHRGDARMRGELSAYMGTGAGVLLANLFGVYFQIPLYSVFCVLLATIALRNIKPQLIQIPKLAFYIAVTLLFVFYLGGAWFSRGAVAEYTQGLAAYQAADWQKAQELACRAADLGPRFSLYAFECGLTSANLFFLESAGPGLGAAAQLIEQGLANDPSWQPYWADLAILEWKQGAERQAIAHMQRAAEAAPDNGIFALNLGWMAEEIGDLELAARAYQQALTIDPWIVEGPYFQDTEIRRSAIETVLKTGLDERPPSIRLAYRALQVKDLDKAQAYLSLARQERPRDPQVWALLGLLASKQGDSQAWVYAQTAVFLEDTNPRVLIWAADVAWGLGYDPEAAALTQRAFAIWVSKLQYDSAQYYFAVYHRPTYGQNYVPGYVRADFTREMVGAFGRLAEFYRTQGDLADAELVQDWLALEGIEITGASTPSN